MSPERPRLQGLYVITDRTLCGESIEQRVAEALRGGARIVQYRDKTADHQRRLREASLLARLCKSHDALFIVNDDIELARGCGADGVHLGKSDGGPAAARQVLGPDAVIGVSCYNAIERARKAQADGADYLAFGRFFPSASKPNAVRADLAVLETARRKLQLPLVAIGGITPENAPLLIEAGADMLAVIQAVFGQPDVEAASRAFSAQFH
jgi:thiamine-phosphate pyrophosphorylase